MERTRSSGAMSDRERREQLESLQVELHDARAELERARVETEKPSPVVALDDAILRAVRRRDEVEALELALRQEADALEREAQYLRKSIEDEHQIRRGAKQRRWDAELERRKMRAVGVNQGSLLPAALILGGLFIFVIFSIFLAEALAAR